jgi:hypothetical protein
MIHLSLTVAAFSFLACLALMLAGTILTLVAPGLRALADLIGAVRVVFWQEVNGEKDRR